VLSSSFAKVKRVLIDSDEMMNVVDNICKVVFSNVILHMYICLLNNLAKPAVSSENWLAWANIFLIVEWIRGIANELK